MPTPIFYRFGNLVINPAHIVAFYDNGELAPSHLYLQNAPPVEIHPWDAQDWKLVSWLREQAIDPPTKKVEA